MALIEELKQQREEANGRYHDYMRDAFNYQTHADVQAQRVRDLDTAIAALTPAPAPVEIEDSLAPEGMPECAWETVTLTEAAPADEQDDVSEMSSVSGMTFVAELDQEITGLAVVDGQLIATLEDGATKDLTDQVREAAISHIQKFAEPAPDPEFVVLDEQTCEPLDADLAQILHDNMDKLLIADEAPALNEAMQDEREQPVTDVAALIASGEHSYDEVAAIAYPEPQWNEPQPTEGYAPVTNPAADEAAKGFDHYDPKAVADRNRFNPFAIFRREPEEV